MSNQLTKQDQIKMTLQAMSTQFKGALPPHIPVDRFIRVAQTAILTNPSILDKDRNSLFASCLKAAEAGLLPDGKEAAFVPFKDQVTFMPMITGIIKKIRNSGDLLTLTSQLVHEKDSFSFYVDENGEHLEHRPNMFGDRGAVIGVYALAKTKDNAAYIEVMTMDQINAIKATSRGNSSPWHGPFWTEMARKSAIRRLSKRLPMSTDIEQLIQNDDQYHDFDETTAPIQQQSETPKKSKLEDALGIKKSDIEAESEEIV